MSRMNEVNFRLPGCVVRPGYWLYIIRVVVSEKRHVHYVGMTNGIALRFGQQLAAINRERSLRGHLEAKRINADKCKSFDFIARGPVVRANVSKANVQAMEKRLATELENAGYSVLNKVQCNHELSENRWAPIRNAFLKDFPKLAMVGAEIG